MRRQVHVATATAIFGCMMILGCQFGIVRSAEKTAEARCGAVQQRNVRKTVVVTVVLLAVALHGKDESTSLLILCHHRGIDRGVEIVAALFQIRCVMVDIDEIARRLFGNDIHHACDGIGTIERRPTATNHFHTVNHTCWHLFQPIDRSQRRENGTRIHQNLRILPFEPVDAQRGNTAIRTRLFHAQTCLESQHVGHTMGCGILEQHGRHDIDNRGRFALLGFVFIGCNHHAINQIRLLAKLNIDLKRRMSLHIHRALLSFITDIRKYHRVTTRRQIFQEIMPCLVGQTAIRSTLQLHTDKRDVCARCLVNHVSNDMSILRIGRDAHQQHHR